MKTETTKKPAMRYTVSRARSFCAAAALALAAFLPSYAADRTVSENWILTQDETVDGSLVIPSGVTVDLNGYKLTAQGVHSGSAPILTDDEDAEYEQLEYVITSNRYVQTTYVPGNTDRAEMLVELPDNSNGFLFSTRDSNYKNAFSCYRLSHSQTRFDLRGEQKTLSVDTTANNNRYYFVINAGDSNGTGFVRANEATATSFDYSSFSKGTISPGGPFVLFAASHWVNGVLDPAGIAYPGKCKFYHFQVKQGDTVKCNIVPAKRVSDGAVGLFDTVAAKFLPARIADNSQSLTSFEQYGEMEADGGTVTSPGSGDMTVNDSARVTSVPAYGMNSDYRASALFNNNFTHAANASHRFIMEVGNLPLKVDYDFGEGTPRAVASYKVWFGQVSGAQYANRAPKAWRFYGSNDNENWTLLDERTNETGWSHNNQSRTYEVENPAPYRRYRIEITANNGGTHMEFVQLEYFNAGFGKLCIDVPEGMSTTNSAISISGGVVVEKDGLGTLNIAKKNNGFGGDGVTTLVVKNGKVTRPPNKILATCGAAKSVIQVLDGGQFDLAGFNYYDYKYTIAGDGPDGRGAIVNDTFVAGWQNKGTWNADQWNGFLGNVTLADDATIGGTETFGMLWYAAVKGGSYAGSTMAMNGHTVTYAGDKSIYSWSMNYSGSGRIAVAEGSVFSITMGTSAMSATGCDVVVNGTLSQNNQSATVKSLSFTATGNYTHSTASPITVYEKYAPNINSTAGKNKHPTVTLGASGHTATTLDLSLFSETFSTSFTTFYSGSTVTVDTGLRALATGDKLVSWSSAPNATFTLKDADTLGFEVTAESDGLYARSTSAPVYAQWDAENETWKYYTSEDVEVPDWTGGITDLMRVRFSSVAEYTAITNAIEVSGIAPRGFLLSSLPLDAGSDEIDLSGLDFTVPENTTIDVKGNSLKLPNSLVGGSVPFTVTSSVAGGKLVVDVPSGETVSNSKTTLTGALRFVKRGAGTFVPVRLFHTYTGGNEIVAGTVKLSNAGSGGRYNGYYNQLGGAASTTTSGGGYAEVDILTGATVDLNGQLGLRSYMFVLKGGTITNTGTSLDNDDTSSALAAMFYCRLEEAERSYFNVPNNIGFYMDLDAPTTLDLGGKTLQVGISSSKKFYFNKTTILNGTLDITSGGNLRTHRNASSARTATIRLNSALWLEKDLTVSNIVVRYNADWDQGSAKLCVYGEFRPEAAGGYFYGPTMQDGSTLDFSAWNADSLGWPVKSRSSRYSPHKKFAFAADAANVKVKIGGISRADALARSESPYVLKWTDCDSEPSGTTFAFAEGEAAARGFVLTKDAMGLKVMTKSGLTISVR